MRIPARDLAVGDVLHINDWHLHVINIERDQALGRAHGGVRFPDPLRAGGHRPVQARAQAA